MNIRLKTKPAFVLLSILLMAGCKYYPQTSIEAARWVHSQLSNDPLLNEVCFENEVSVEYSLKQPENTNNQPEYTKVTAVQKRCLTKSHFAPLDENVPFYLNKVYETRIWGPARTPVLCVWTDLNGNKLFENNKDELELSELEVFNIETNQLVITRDDRDPVYRGCIDPLPDFSIAQDVPRTPSPTATPVQTVTPTLPPVATQTATATPAALCPVGTTTNYSPSISASTRILPDGSVGSFVNVGINFSKPVLSDSVRVTYTTSAGAQNLPLTLVKKSNNYWEGERALPNSLDIRGKSFNMTTFHTFVEAESGCQYSIGHSATVSVPLNPPF